MRYIPELTVVAIRVVATYIILNAAYYLPISVGMALRASTAAADVMYRATLWNSVVASTIYLLVGLALFCYAGRIASWVLRGLDFSSTDDAPLTSQSLERLAISILGLAVVVSAVPTLVQTIAEYIFPEVGGQYGAMRGRVTWELPVGDTVGLIVRVALGFFLWLRADSVIEFGRREIPVDNSKESV